MLDGLLLFAILFTSDFKVPLSAFEGVPFWVLVAVPAMTVVAFQNTRRSRTVLVVGMGVFSLLLVNIVGANFVFPGHPNVTRQLVSAAAAALSVGVLAATGGDDGVLLLSLCRAMKLFIVMQLLTMLLQFGLGAASVYEHYFLPISRHSGLFTEPSFVAVAATPALALMVHLPSLWRREFGLTYTLMFAAILVLCPSSSLVAIGGAVVASRAAFGGRRTLTVLALSAMLLLFVGIPLANEYRHVSAVAERTADLIDALSGGGGDALNLSSLLFAKAVHILASVLVNYPLGAGYDNFVAANSIYAPEFTSLFVEVNERDGTSFLLKFLTEFGWLGIILIGSMVMALGDILRRRPAYDPGRTVAAIALCVLFANSVRGGSYFFGGILVPFAVAIRFSLLARLRLGGG